MRQTAKLSLAPMIVAWSVASGVAADAKVELRGTEPMLSVDRAVMEVGGVRVTKTGGVTSVIAWDMVRKLDGAEPGTLDAGAAKDAIVIADDLWRARTRLQRGDVQAAAPLFERHFERFRGTTSETALVVAEGTLRCRLATDDWMAAIVPALEVARLRKAGVVTDRYAALVPVMDEATLLSPQLAPTWKVDERTKAIAQSIETAVFTDPAVARLASAYVALLRGTMPADAAPKAGAKDAKATGADAPGVALLHAIARLRAGTDGERAQATEELIGIVKAAPEWVRAWANYSIGRATVDRAAAANDRAASIDGVLALTRVAAQPGAPRRLVIESLALAVSTLQALGDADGAAALERERAALAGTTPKLASPKGPPKAPAAPQGPVSRLDLDDGPHRLRLSHLRRDSIPT
ncbi:MAG: hypothetical protein JNM94_10300 [Phycisphaerae bacterium]|nr:hypothetical protein [Phycisphaerae bacterium]